MADKLNVVSRAHRWIFLSLVGGLNKSLFVVTAYSTFSPSKVQFSFDEEFYKLSPFLLAFALYLVVALARRDGRLRFQSGRWKAVQAYFRSSRLNPMRPAASPERLPRLGRIAVKVINHLGDEVMKVFRV